MDDRLKYGMVGSIFLLAVFGGTIVLTDDQMDNAWVCPDTLEWGLFHNMSLNNRTAYHYIEEIQFKSYCQSHWVKLDKFINTKRGKALSETPTEELQCTLKSDVKGQCCPPDGKPCEDIG